MEIEKVIKVGVSKCVLDLLTAEEITQIAVSALENEVENSELLELAMMAHPQYFEAKDIFLTAAAKLGLVIPDTREATLCVAKEWSTKIIDGSISPYEGARKIWWELSTIKGAHEGLNVFAGLASEIEDTQNPDFRVVYEQDIIKEANKILDT